MHAHYIRYESKNASVACDLQRILQFVVSIPLPSMSRQVATVADEARIATVSKYSVFVLSCVDIVLLRLIVH